MVLIESEIINNNLFQFYDGIDFDLIKYHPDDGTSGFLIFLVDSLIKEIESYNRNRKLNSILTGCDFIPFDTNEMSNDYVCIYLTEGVGIKTMINVVKEKINYMEFLNFSDSPRNNTGYDELH